MIVRFIGKFNCYNPGERASFSEEDAQALISRGFAVPDAPPEIPVVTELASQPLAVEPVAVEAEPVQAEVAVEAVDDSFDKSAKGRRK